MFEAFWEKLRSIPLRNSDKLAGFEKNFYTIILMRSKWQQSSAKESGYHIKYYRFAVPIRGMQNRYIFVQIHRNFVIKHPEKPKNFKAL